MRPLLKRSTHDPRRTSDAVVTVFSMVVSLCQSTGHVLKHMDMLGTGRKLSLEEQNRTHFELYKPNKAIASSSMMRSMIILIYAVGQTWLVKGRMMQDDKNIF